jgi:DNA-binding MarR family transcriptional regulator
MDPALTPNTPLLQERFDALLVEVNGLANRLKATDPRVAIPIASRAALQVLQRYGPQTVPQIARARFSSRQNIQILINRLKEEGLVEFVGNPDHKRSALVRLTNRGQIAIAQATVEESRLSTELLPSFSQTELSYATEVLNKLRKLLDGKEKVESSVKETQAGSARSERSNSMRHQQSTTVAHTQAEEHVPSEMTESEPTDDGGLPVSLL